MRIPSRNRTLVALVIWALLAGLGLTGCGTTPAIPQPERNQLQSLPASATTPPAIKDFLTPFSGIWMEFELRQRRLEQELRDYLSKPSAKP